MSRSNDSRSDLFSFGSVLYEMATGRLPFEGSSSGELCSAVLRDEPTPAAQINPRVPVDLETVMRKALEKDRDLRYQHAADMRADLQRLKRDTESGRHPECASRQQGGGDAEAHDASRQHPAHS